MRPLTAMSTFRRLPPERRRWVTRALWLVPLVRVGLWLFPYGRVRDVLAREPAPASPSRPQPMTERVVNDVVWAVTAVSRRVPRATCLTQALVARRLLADASVAAEVRIGVARDAAGVFEAHAWLEYEGRIVLGEVEGMERFTTLNAGGEAP